jgi:glycosyltransferase involved in cell wall biosynthesis
MRFSSLSIVVPTKNEGEGIARVLEALKPYSDDIIVVDAHSRDDTSQIASRLGVRFYLDNGKGKGDAMQVGIAHAKGDVILFFDGDGSHEPNDIPRFVSPILEGRADLVIGSRRTGGSEDVEISWRGIVRAFGCDLIVMILNHRWNAHFTDVLYSFRAIRRDIVQSLELKATDFLIEQEMVIACLKKGYRILEIPSHEYARGWGVPKLKTITGIKFLWHLFR